MKKSVTAAALLVSLALAAVGCGGSAQSTPKASSKTPFKIGMLVEQTGFFSWYGNENLNAAKLWAKEQNKKGGVDGHPVKLITYDTASKPSQAVQGYKSLKAQGVQAIVGVGLIVEWNAVAPLAKTGPLFYTTCGICQSESPTQFASLIFSGQLETAMMQWLKKNGITRVAYLSTNNATGQVSIKPIEAMTKSTNMVLTDQELFDPSSVDVTAQLTRIAQSKPQVLVAWLVGKPLGVVLQGVHQLGLNIPVVTSDGNLTPAFLKSLSSIAPKKLYFAATPDMTYGNLPKGDPHAPLIKAFDASYKAAYNQTPGLGAGDTYDALNLIAKGVTASGSLNPTKIAAAMQKIQGYVGLDGTYNFSSTDHRGLGVKDAVLIQFKDGKLVYATAP